MDRRDGEDVEIERANGSDDDRTSGRKEPTGGARTGGGETAARTGGLADELGRISIRSTPEGYVEGRVTELEAVDATTVRLAVRLPHGRTVAFALEKPIPWAEEFLLARIVSDLGYDAASIDHIVGETVYVARSDLEADERSEWEPIRAATDFLEASLDVRFGERETGPTWRLVDPRELPDPEEEARPTAAVTAASTAVIVLGAVAAAAGAVGATGSPATSIAVVSALPGLALVLVGLAVLHWQLG